MKFWLAVTFYLGLSWTVTEAALLFNVGQEFEYSYETLVTAGSEKPTSYASAYKLKGRLLVTSVSTTVLSIGLEDLTVGLYNGPWTYFPIPDMEFFTSADLTPLAERFHVNIDNGKVKSIVLNDQEPEWASNMKRGLATYLQMEMGLIRDTELEVLSTSELTTMGECNTKYEVLPATTTINKLFRVSKFRNHADCPDMPTRTRYGAHIFYSCQDEQTRDIMNSTSYATYEMEMSSDGQSLLKTLTVFSSILYWPFTTHGPYQFSWLNMTLSLVSISRFGNKDYPPPENAETHEDLSYIFEQSDPYFDPEDENPDLKTEPIFFHHTSIDSDPDTLQKTSEMIEKAIMETAEALANTETYFADPEKIHSSSPLAYVGLISTLDYDSLKALYNKFSAAATSQSKTTELQLFLDGVILSGTNPALLVIRDILVATVDEEILSRLAPSIPHFLRNPNEALAKEMDPLFELTEKTGISSSVRRMLTLSMATLIGRCCRKTNCTSTGLLDKYVRHFENKLSTATDFDSRTLAVLSLRNLKYGGALDRVLDIASGELIYEKPVRIQAIWSLRDLVYQNRQQVFDKLLPVFYNRSESCEVRNSVFGFLMGTSPDEKILLEIAYYLWTEFSCPSIGNMVRSFLTNAANSVSPCNKIKTYARTILNYLPPGDVTASQTASYEIDYYDKDNGFGHQVYSTIERTGKSSTPVSLYIGLNNFIGGFGSSYLGVYLRLEGLGESVAKKLAMASGDVEAIKKILGKIGVSQRPIAPLFLEFTVVYHDYAVLHYSLDENTISSLPAVWKKLGTLVESNAWNWERSLLLGGYLREFPLEIGTPISIGTYVIGVGSVVNNITRAASDGSYSEESSFRLQFHLFGQSHVTNHAPSIGTAHSVFSHRALRLVYPRRFKIEANMQDYLLNIIAHPPSKQNPMIAIAHSTATTSMNYDSPTRVKDIVVQEMLKKSCPTCEMKTTISKGPDYRKSRVLPVTLPSFLRGVKSEAKYFDCEKDHSRITVLKRMRSFFSDDTKNTGIFSSPLTKLFLSLTHARDYIFISPYPETCGIYATIYSDPDSQSPMQTVEGQVKGSFAFGTDGTAPSFNLTLNSKLNINYGGTKPSATRLKFFYNLEEYSEVEKFSAKYQLSDEMKDSYGIVCVNGQISLNRLPKDMLSFEGENEPKIEENVVITMGKLTKDEAKLAEPNCLTNYAEIKIIGTASRSIEQIEESNSDISPYKECKAQKLSALYPGPYQPPSTQCFAAMVEQTNLRAGNATISFSINQEAYKVWSRKSSFIWALLQMYAVEIIDETTEIRYLKSSTDQREGEITIDVNVKKHSPPTMDIDYIDITQNETTHYHGIDFTMIPEMLKPRSIPSRISPGWGLGFQYGLFSYCSVTPNVITTLDHFTYPASLSNCWTLIGGDCGPNSEFVVMGKRLSPEKLAILVHIGDSKIEFQGDTNPTIDGTPVRLEGKNIYNGSPTEPLPFSVFKNGDEVYVIAQIAGIYIRYTGNFVVVTLSTKYRGVHCGLCGHWDSSYYNDLVGPDSSCPLLLRPDDMVKAYIVNEGNCATLRNPCATQG